MDFAFSRASVFAIAVISVSACAGMEPVPIVVGSVDEFSIPTTDGEAVSFSRDPSVKFHVLCFLGTECPLARIYGPRLEKMSHEFAAGGVRFIGINSNIQDSMDELKDYVQLYGITFPVAKDYDRQVALQAGATRTPEVFLVDQAGVIRYQGRIDDQYQPGIARKKATQHDLRDAINELLAGKSVTQSRTSAVGCLISLPRITSKKSDVTFCNQVVKILHKHCVECHRSGEIGPFALDQYDEVVGWADMSLEVIEQGRMPPWHANPEHGSFVNARHMSESDKGTLRSWVEAGMPYGDASQLPPKPTYVQGWRLPEPPHAVFQISETPFNVPAEGTVDYHYAVVDPGFTEDKWVRAAQVIPGNRSVVHHCIAFTRPPDGDDFRDIGLLSAYVPGQVPGDLPDGYAQCIPAGSRIIFQMHYTPTGKPEQDITRLGLVFMDSKDVTHEVIALGGIQDDFEVPPRAANHAVDGNVSWFPKNGLLLSITPHMHLRGKAFEFRSERQGKTTTLLDVPAYDFNWQHNYQLSSPLPLDQIDKLSFSAVFDNSDDNPTNPDSSQYVTWGDQTWQEMAVTFISVARPLGKQANARRRESKPDRVRNAKQSAVLDQQAKEFADRYIARFDANGDQYLTSLELPNSVRLFSFWAFDHNGDERLSHDEIKAEEYRRLNRSKSKR